MNLPLKDLKKETLVELASLLGKNFVWADNKLKTHWYTHPYPKKCWRVSTSETDGSWYHDRVDEWCNCLDNVFKKLKVWKFTEGEDFPSMSNRVGNRVATLFLVSNGVIHCNRPDCDCPNNNIGRCISPLPENLFKFFEPAILDKLNEWLKKLDLIMDSQDNIIREILIK